jgi:hypothetical protein
MKQTHHYPQVIKPVTAPMNGLAIAMLILDAVAELHQRGHQRLRIYPNISGAGSFWRTRVVDVDTARFDTWGWPDWDGRSFGYTMGTHHDVGGMLVDADTTATQVAERILVAFPDPRQAGRGRDWMYAGWYAELLGSAREHHNLPVGDELITVHGGRRWGFVPEAGNSIEEPPLPAPTEVR